MIYKNILSWSRLPLIALTLSQPTFADQLIAPESVPGNGVWTAPELKDIKGTVRVTVWFDKQLLGDGKAYKRRAKEFSDLGRIELRKRSIASLKNISAESHKKAASDLQKLVDQKTITKLQKHWIINGFSCTLQAKDIAQLAKVEGVKKIFSLKRRSSRPNPQNPKPKAPDSPKKTEPANKSNKPKVVANPDRPEKVSSKNIPWYVKALKADQVWTELGITGKGTLNIIHDKNFICSPSLSRTIYINAGETPGNGKDDDGNGLIDDVHGYNFAANSALLQTAKLTGDESDRKKLHGTSCAHIISGAESKKDAPQFGIAPQSHWAGVIARENVEPAIEWAIEQGADTYSMSFTRFNLGETKSHWRKMMEHGSYCGVFFVSGAGNYAAKKEVPEQMAPPQSIPEAVFAAAGVKQDLSRTPFSSKGPVIWDTEHYQDGEVKKPEVCAFNYKVPLLMPDDTVSKQTTLNGNSYAGPMFCGSIALMVSADPDLLPWDLQEIITSTATDVGPEGVDLETGHGLINCYKAVKEVIRRRDLRKK